MRYCVGVWGGQGRSLQSALSYSALQPSVCFASRIWGCDRGADYRCQNHFSIRLRRQDTRLEQGGSKKNPPVFRASASMWTGRSAPPPSGPGCGWRRFPALLVPTFMSTLWHSCWVATLMSSEKGALPPPPPNPLWCRQYGVTMAHEAVPYLQLGPSPCKLFDSILCSRTAFSVARGYVIYVVDGLADKRWHLSFFDNEKDLTCLCPALIKRGILLVGDLFSQSDLPSSELLTSVGPTWRQICSEGSGDFLSLDLPLTSLGREREGWRGRGEGKRQGGERGWTGGKGGGERSRWSHWKGEPGNCSSQFQGLMVQYFAPAPPFPLPCTLRRGGVLVPSSEWGSQGEAVTEGSMNRGPGTIPWAVKESTSWGRCCMCAVTVVNGHRLPGIKVEKK